MSHFSDVDASPSVAALTNYLQRTDVSMAPLKSYVATAAAHAVPGGVVVDVGCGLGADLARLADAGMRPIGIDRSAAFLAAAAGRGLPIAQADAGTLPIRGASVDGVRIERTLEHVVNPGAVLDEVARVLRPGGWVWILEPNFATFRVASAKVSDGSWPAAFLTARHPNIGRDLERALATRRFVVHDVVRESSRGYAFEGLPVDAARVMERAVQDGRCAEADAAAWLDEQRSRAARGTFRARWDKILVVARLG